MRIDTRGLRPMPPKIRRHAAELAGALRYPGRWRLDREAIAAGDPHGDRYRQDHEDRWTLPLPLHHDEAEIDPNKVMICHCQSVESAARAVVSHRATRRSVGRVAPSLTRPAHPPARWP
jgi:hypothetical protein